MNPQQVENLKKLIAQSALLNAAERQEWLSLLDLMNDKQLMELGEILQGPQKPVIQPKPVMDSVPHMSHILNMPTPQEKAAHKPVVNPAAPSQLKPAPAPKPSTQFAEKLKNILQEKDLPKPQKKEPLEIPAHVLQTPTPKPVFPTPVIPHLPKNIQASPPVLERKDSPIPEKPKIIPQVPPVQTKPAAPILTITPKPQPNITQIPKQTVPEPLIVKPIVQPEVYEKIPAQMENKTVTPKVAASTEPFVPGLKNSEMLVRAQLDTSTKSFPTNSAARNLAAPTNSLDTLQDLSTLNLDNFLALSVKNLLVKFSALIKKFGYHEVIFNFEKSPLFGNYVDTGLFILEKQTNFEDASTKIQAQNNKVFLTRQEFERVSDILRDIKMLV